MEELTPVETIEVDPQFAGWRLDAYLATRLKNISRSRIKKVLGFKILREGANNSKDELIKGSTKIRGGERYTVYMSPPNEPQVDCSYQVLWEDNDYFAVSKSGQIVCHPCSSFIKQTLTTVVNKQFPTANLAHRLDRETSGIVLFSKHLKADRAIKLAFEKHNMHKQYWAIVKGQITSKGTINQPLGLKPYDPIWSRSEVRSDGAHAVTHYAPICSNSEATLLKLQLETGRSHQIRVHLEFIGHPILGDKIYGHDGLSYLQLIKGGMEDALSDEICFERHALHHKEFGFQHPLTRESILCTSSLPQDFKRFLKEVGLELPKDVESQP